MGFGIGPLELLMVLIFAGFALAVLLGGGFVLALVFGAGRGRTSGSESGGFSLGHARLNCPNCQHETTAGRPQCEHCGKDL